MPSQWSRRRALRLLAGGPGIGLAGCLGGPAGSGGTLTAESTAVDVSFTATVERSFADDHPGRIHISLANEGGVPFAMTVARGIEGPLSVIKGDLERGDATMLLLAEPPGGDHETPPGAPCESGAYAIPDEPAGGCWQPACEIPRVTAHYAIPVAAGETLAWPYVALDGFNDPCLPPGTYNFQETAAIALGQAAGGTTPPGSPTHYLDKRVTIDLADDGTLRVDAAIDPQPVPDSERTEATAPDTPKQADG